ncbi:MAG: hypothetical protein HY925_03650 [Elusimicrobia bacterium]|nr:hypothetical protein [Elusimicrobiota bacterium]
MNESEAQSRRLLLAFVSLAVAVGFCFRLNSIGFYNDDYPWLEMWSQAPSQTPWGIAAYWVKEHAAQWFRPGTILFHPLEFWFFGFHAVPYQLALLAIHIGISYALFHLLEGEGVERRLAAFAAAAAGLYPNHDATRHWACLTGAPLALLSTLWALLAYRSWQKGKGAWWLALSFVSFAFGTLLYEAGALLAALPICLDWRDRVEKGASPKEAILPSILSGLPLIGLLGAIVVYQRGYVPRYVMTERHPVSLSPAHVFKVLGSGLECTIANRLLHYIGRSAAYAWRSFTFSDWALWLIAAAGMTKVIVVGAPDRAPEKAEKLPLLPLLGLGFFLLGYAPYFFDATYTPVVFAQVNRVNMVASLGGACWLAWLYGRGRNWTAKASAAILAAFLLASWSSSAQWADAYVMQKSAIEKLKPKLGAPGEAKTILLYGLPDSLGSATVFQSTYDFDVALRLGTGDKALSGRVGQDRVRFEDKQATLVWFGESPLSYASLYAFHVPSGRFARIDGRAAGERFLALSK